MRRFFGTSRLVSVLKVERLVSSSEFEKMEHLGLASVLKVDRLSLVLVLWTSLASPSQKIFDFSV